MFSAHEHGWEAVMEAPYSSNEGSYEVIEKSPAMASHDDDRPSADGSAAMKRYDPYAEAHLTPQERISRAFSRFLKGKDEQWTALSKRNRPLTLLELPVDVLTLILKEVTHTNDLTALSLTNSALYRLAVPHIYARFDIVWPDGNLQTTESKSVDALTYGLSTLTFGSMFARVTRKLYNPGLSSLSRFRDIDYARYTRKFSLGNGPEDWVSEYMITKESGKMLGTLVAIAVAKMVNLETFVWDMPTGVLADIFMALASLGDSQRDSRAAGEGNDESVGSKGCRLDRVWIRWHDNEDVASVLPTAPATAGGVAAGVATANAALVPLGSTLTAVGIMLPANAVHPPPRGPIPYAEHHVEYPTFSVLPPIKSLTVLEIDDMAYLDEMSMLIEKSKDRLQELRVGISAKAAQRDFVQTWDGPGLKQVDHKARWPGENTIGERRLGGVLGVLVGRIYDIKKRASYKSKESTISSSPATAGHVASHVSPSHVSVSGSSYLSMSGATSNSLHHIAGLALDLPLPSPSSSKHLRSKRSQKTYSRRRLDGKLKLHTLELERIPLSMQVCRHALDWSVLTTITILECAQHENLWKMLRKQFQPTAQHTTISSNRGSSDGAMTYHLALKHIHTDITTPALIAFIKETLAPNSLEVLFIQDRRRSSGPPPVTIDQIFKGALKRHRSSLRKLLIDSSGRAPSENVRWRNWVLTSAILLYVTSGRMAELRELSVSLAYKDWHTFLQRLPNLPHLRSLHIPAIADHVSSVDPRELAMQISDIITLRSEIQLCYVGITNKCFEIQETRGDEVGHHHSHPFHPHHQPAQPHHHTALGPYGLSALGTVDHGPSADENGAEDTSNDGEDAEDDMSDSDDAGIPQPMSAHTPVTDPDQTQSDTEDGHDVDGDDNDDDDFEDPMRGATRLKLREILFYDDKVAVFKARHAKL